MIRDSVHPIIIPSLTGRSCRGLRNEGLGEVRRNNSPTNIKTYPGINLKILNEDRKKNNSFIGSDPWIISDIGALLLQ
jgi:hypothetical protein